MRFIHLYFVSWNGPCRVSERDKVICSSWNDWRRDSVQVIDGLRSRMPIRIDNLPLDRARESPQWCESRSSIRDWRLIPTKSSCKSTQARDLLKSCGIRKSRFMPRFLSAEMSRIVSNVRRKFQSVPWTQSFFSGILTVMKPMIILWVFILKASANQPNS